MAKTTGKKKTSAKKPAKARITTKKSTAPLRPLGDRVLLKPIAADEGKMLPSGIIIPETVDKEKPEQGTVIAVGPGRRDEKGALVPMGVEVGDRVVFSKYGYDEVKVNGVEYYIVKEENILAVLS